MEKILDYPKVIKDNKLVGEGGNQDWFTDKWARMAGCGSVSATDIYMYYTNKEHTFDKEDYLKEMEKMFKIMEPGKRGFPYVYLYARRLGKILDKRYEIIRNPHFYQASEFIIKNIDNDNPIGLLVLTHRHRKVHDDLWHWVTIFGYQEGRKGLEVILMDCGKKKSIPARILSFLLLFKIILIITIFF